MSAMLTNVDTEFFIDAFDSDLFLMVHEVVATKMHLPPELGDPEMDIYLIRMKGDAGDHDCKHEHSVTLALPIEMLNDMMDNIRARSTD